MDLQNILGREVVHLDGDLFIRDHIDNGDGRVSVARDGIWYIGCRGLSDGNPGSVVVEPPIGYVVADITFNADR